MYNITSAFTQSTQRDDSRVTNTAILSAGMASQPPSRAVLGADSRLTGPNTLNAGTPATPPASSLSSSQSLAVTFITIEHLSHDVSHFRSAP